MVKTRTLNKSGWYLLYTRPRAEKKVAEELRNQGFEIFLPLRKTLNQWSDRKKWVEEPVFKGYVFIYTELERCYFSILSINGVSRFVHFENGPVRVDKREIDMIRKIQSFEPAAESVAIESFAEGDRVEIISGPFRGTKGIWQDFSGNQKFLIELESIRQGMSLTINKMNVRKIEQKEAVVQ